MNVLAGLQANSELDSTDLCENPNHRDSAFSKAECTTIFDKDFEMNKLFFVGFL